MFLKLYATCLVARQVGAKMAGPLGLPVRKVAPAGRNVIEAEVGLTQHPHTIEKSLGGTYATDESSPHVTTGGESHEPLRNDALVDLGPKSTRLRFSVAFPSGPVRFQTSPHDSVGSDLTPHWAETPANHLASGPNFLAGKILTYEDLPAHLQHLGEKLLGSSAEVKHLMERTSPIKALSDDGVLLSIVSALSDNTQSRLQSEMSGDRYSIRKVSSEDGVIIDIGSNIGDMAITSAKIHPRMQILAFEPVPTTYFYLRLNMWLNNVAELQEMDLGRHPEKAGVLALHSAVTSDGRQVEVSWTDSNSQEAAVDTHEGSVRSWSKSTIPSVALPDFLKHHKIDHIGLFKIDCEGCEFEVIPSMHALFNDKGRVQRVVGEIHQSLKSSVPTNAAKAPADYIKAMDEALAARGCPVGVWKVAC